MVDVDDQFFETGSPLLAGRYRLGARRGSAHDAAFFDAVDEELQQLVVVKVVHPEVVAADRVHRAMEATVRSVAEVHHPNIAAVFDHGFSEWNGREVLFVVSEHLTGGSVRDLLDRGRLLTPSQALVVALDACKGLDALHRRGLVHGDVRPATLVFGEDRRPRLVDAGLNYLIAEAAGGITTRSNDLAKYASPEQASGGAVQPKSDVYALCLTVLEMVTGTVPFVGDSTVATLANRVDRLMPASADLGSLASVLERAGRPDPRDRSSAAEFGRSLVQAAGRLPRPAALPLLVGSLFGPDTTALDAPVDPTGPLHRPVVPEAVPHSQPALAVAAAPSHAAFASPEVVPPPAPTTPAEPAPSDDAEFIDPGDEFPDQPPAPVHRRWFILLLLLLAAAGGALAWYNTQPEEVVVPDVVGMQSAAAANQLGDFETVVVEEADEQAPVGEVIRIEPVAGSRVDEGTSVTLFVSSGPAPRVLPELTALTVEEAIAKLEGLGLAVEQADPVFDEAVPQGVVVSWTVPDSPSLTAGGTVLRGTTVRLVVSAGPAPRTVPNLAGSTLEAATSSLKALGLEIAQLPDEYSMTVPAGQVLRQDPAPGSELARGATVTVVLSKGPEMVVLPDLAGLNFNGIRAALEGAGWSVGTVYGDPATAPLNKTVVNGVEVQPGFSAPKGTRVDLVFIPDAPPA